MNGELNFKQSLIQRVKLLKGIETSSKELIKSKLTFTKGAKILCKCLKKLKIKTAVISGFLILI